MSQATCKFCSCTDDSIQVICELRCLICSRCQQISIIRKLLIDHTVAIDVNAAGTSQQTQTYLKGFCPICESAMSSTMLGLISSYKELYKLPVEDKNMGRHFAGIELEEYSTTLAGFLRRYRSTYEAGPDYRRPLTVKDANTTSNVSGNNNSNQNNVETRYALGTTDVYELYAMPPRSSISAMLEFVTECYCTFWQNILRNGKESMIPIMMRVLNRKRFSQRTNDLRAKAVLDFMAAPYGSDTMELLLFGRLIGLQPRQTANIHPAWAHITASILAAGHCDRCLKTEQLIDITGNPSAVEFKQRLQMGGRQSNAGPTLPYNQPKTILLRKALRIIALLFKVNQCYWVMAPLIPYCVENSCKLPWQPMSIAKLINILLFVTLFEEHPLLTPSTTVVATATGNVGATIVGGGGGNMNNNTNSANSAVRNNGAVSKPASMSSMTNILPSISRTVGNAGDFNNTTTAAAAGNNNNISGSDSGIASESNSVSQIYNVDSASVNSSNNSVSSTNRINKQSSNNSSTNNQYLPAAITRNGSVQSITSNATNHSVSANKQHAANTTNSSKSVPPNSNKAVLSPVKQQQRGVSNNTNPGTERSSRRPSITDNSEDIAAAGATTTSVYSANNNNSGNSSKLAMLRSLDIIISKLWSASAQVNSSTSAEYTSKEAKLFFLTTLDKHNFPSYLDLDLQKAAQLVDPQQTILLSELAYVCIHCWDAEYADIKQAIATGQLTCSRRPAISGFYDTNKSSLKGVERLCMVRLLHWYSDAEDFRGIDWEDVSEKSEKRMFPFDIPFSLLQKSRNELNHLSEGLALELREQKMKDAIEDDELLAEQQQKLQRKKILTSAVTSSNATINNNNSGGNGMDYYSLSADMMMEYDEAATIQEIDEFNREQYLASQSLGYVDRFLKDNVAADLAVAAAVGKTQKKQRGNSMGAKAVFVTDSEEAAILRREIDFAKEAAEGRNLATTGSGSSDDFDNINIESTAAAASMARSIRAGLTRPLSPIGRISSIAGVNADAKRLTKLKSMHTAADAAADSESGTTAAALSFPSPFRRSRTAVTLPTQDVLHAQQAVHLVDILDVEPSALASSKLFPNTLSSNHNNNNSMDTTRRRDVGASSNNVLRDGQQDNSGNYIVGKHLTPLETQLMNTKINHTINANTTFASKSRGGGKQPQSVGFTTTGTVLHYDEDNAVASSVENSEQRDFVSVPAVATSIELGGAGRNSNTYSRAGMTMIEMQQRRESQAREEADVAYNELIRSRRRSQLTAAQSRVQLRIDAKLIAAERQKEREKEAVARGTGSAVGVAVAGTTDQETTSNGAVVVMPLDKTSSTSVDTTQVPLPTSSDDLSTSSDVVGTGNGMNSITNTTDVSHMANSSSHTNNTMITVHWPDIASRTVPRNRNPLLRSLPVLDFNQYVNNVGGVTIDLVTHLSAQSAVKMFVLRGTITSSSSTSTALTTALSSRKGRKLEENTRSNSSNNGGVVETGKISLTTFEYIVHHYFKPWHFEHLLRIDLLYMRCGGYEGAQLLSAALLLGECRLIHLNLTGSQIGGKGIRSILQAINNSGGASSLLRLDLQDNLITMASGSLAYLASFVNLRALDLSKNGFTLDSTSQCNMMTEALSPLHSLQSLSLAFNKIQDRGCYLICDIVRCSLPNIVLLDLAGCFLTKECLPALEHMLTTPGGGGDTTTASSSSSSCSSASSSNTTTAAATSAANVNLLPPAASTISAATVNLPSLPPLLDPKSSSNSGSGGSSTHNASRVSIHVSSSSSSSSSLPNSSSNNNSNNSSAKLERNTTTATSHMGGSGGAHNASKVGSNNHNKGSNSIPCALVQSSSNPVLSEIMLQENVFGMNHMNDYMADHPSSILMRSTCRLNINSSKYVGMSFPLRYELRDYGIDSYIIK